MKPSLVAVQPACRVNGVVAYVSFSFEPDFGSISGLVKSDAIDSSVQIHLMLAHVFSSECRFFLVSILGMNQ